MCLHFYLVLFEQVGYSIFLVQYRKVFSDQYNVLRQYNDQYNVLRHAVSFLKQVFEINETVWFQSCQRIHDQAPISKSQLYSCNS